MSSNSPEIKRRVSGSNRFSIEKVGENDLNGSIKAIDESFVANTPKPSRLPIDSDQQPKSPTSVKDLFNHPPVLKKTVTHYLHDDDFFELDSAQNTARDRKNYLQTQSSYKDEKEPLNGSISNNNKIDDSASVGCFQISYDEKNDPVAITCNLNSEGVNAYKNCVQDFKTILLYQKLIAEYLGTMLLTLYACSIGLPIVEKSVPSINGKILGKIF
jgi:hypothetical protein